VAADTIPQRLLDQALRRPSAPAYHSKTGESWKPTSFREYANLMRRAGRALIALGFAPGQSTCILGFNRPEWIIFDLATMAAGGAPAGIYTTCSPEEVQYIVHHAEAPVVLVENHSQWEKIRQQRDNLPHLKYVVLMGGAEKVDDPMVLTWAEFVAKADEVEESKLDERIEALDPDALATFIYTSGTTGPPKGVMLSHRNLTWTASCARELTGVGPNDCSLSYLPLSHIAEQMFSLHVPITVGSSVYFAESIEAVPENIKEVQPTVFFGVPRIWEKFHAAVSGKLKQAPPIRQKLVSWAMNVARQVNDLRNKGRQPQGLLNIQYKIADKVIFSKLKPMLGFSRARICVSGAAPVGKEILEFFSCLDIPILEVYGQSEDTGPTSFNRPGRTKLGTVGPAIPGLDVKIAEDGEICVKGPNVFLGYYKDEAATAETLSDGWLLTGDLGAFDNDGFLSITGRKKEIIITAGGKNIAPKNIENALKNHDLIAEAVVIGDRRKYLSALVTLTEEDAAKFAEKHSLSVTDLYKSEAIQKEIQRAVDEVNSHFARVEQIKRFTVLPRNFAIETGELTPTLKIKRKIVYKNFAKEIDAMYPEDAPTTQAGASA
jgi:long-chain acyl-CoA synthetase